MRAKHAGNEQRKATVDLGQLEHPLQKNFPERFVRLLASLGNILVEVGPFRDALVVPLGVLVHVILQTRC